ncbi:MAG: histidine phosphatase family protein [Candidatus Thorarchaeota archaeon]
MPKNTLIFLRHAETKVDRTIKISDWELTEQGIKEALRISQNNLFNDIDIIITSNEKKAYHTVLPLAEKKKKEIIREKELDEIIRDNGKFLGKNDYLSTMRLCMENRDKSFNHWETANHALERFAKKVEDIDNNYNKKKILIVAHGGVINLYFAKLQNSLSNVYERAQSNTFCDYGIIRNGDVIKDISKVP